MVKKAGKQREAGGKVSARPVGVSCLCFIENQCFGVGSVEMDPGFQHRGSGRYDEGR